LEQMLAGICTPAALSALAAYARETRAEAKFAAIGFWIPPNVAAAIPRLTRQRNAVELHVVDNVDGSGVNAVDRQVRKHPVGLPLDAVMRDPVQSVVTWHYCSLDLAEVAGLPPVATERLHILSPP
jgi:hypothetical protein